MTYNRKDIGAGLIFLIVGAGFAGIAYAQLGLGSMLRMGPGYFPLVLGVLMAILGVAIMLRGLRRADEPISRPSWRAVIAITSAPIIFALTLRGLGVIGSVALTTGAASLATATMGWRDRVLTVIGLTIGTVIVFVFLLGLNLPLVGRWLGG
jgi:hypothetical protein